MSIAYNGRLSSTLDSITFNMEYLLLTINTQSSCLSAGAVLKAWMLGLSCPWTCPVSP